MRIASLVFRNAARLRRAPLPGVGGGAVVARRAGVESAAATRPGPGRRGRRLGGGLLAPGFVDAHVHAVQGGLELTRCNLAEGGTREEYLATRPGVRRGAPRRAVDPRRRLGDGRLPGRYADRGRPRRRRARPPGVPAQPRPPRRLGEHPRARARRHQPARAPSRRTAATSATPTATRPAPCTRGRWTSSPGCCRRSPTTSTTQRSWPARPSCTARDHRLAGRDRGGVRRDGRPRTDVPRGRAARRPHGADVVGALWWDREAGEEQVESLVERRRAFTHGRFRATSVKVMQDGVAENFTAALTAPYLDRCGHATANSGHSFVDPALLRRVRRPAGRRGLPGARARHRRPRRARGAGRLRRAPTPAPPAPRSRTCSWCTPTTYAASPSSAWRPTCRRCGPASTTRWSS